ncbi:hypothetical protein GCM10008931_43680 [Oceanobacillus oncorhynchi subsp. oncorhynchi]|uniref:hypothetical protein n=1 Tax=Oceanobacillus oncorhynchi TaxID=545501 RepID=UPI0031E27454
MNIKLKLERKPNANKGNIGRKAHVHNIDAQAYLNSVGRKVKKWYIHAKAAGLSRFCDDVYVVNEKRGYVALGKEDDIDTAIAWVKRHNVIISEEKPTNIVEIKNVEPGSGVMAKDNSLFVDSMEIKFDYPVKLLSWIEEGNSK